MKPEQNVYRCGDDDVPDSIETEGVNMNVDQNAYPNRDEAGVSTTDAYETIIWLLAIVFCLEFWGAVIAFIR